MAKVEKRSVLLLALIFVAWGFGYVDRQAINIAAVSIREELALTTGEMGIVMSSFFCMYSVMTLGGSFLANRFGTRRSLLGIVFLWAVFSGMTGAAGSFLLLVSVRFLLGLSQGGFAPITSVAVTELFPPEQQGRAKAFQVSAGSAGVAFGALFCATSTALFGWRMMFLFFGVIGLVITILLYQFYHVQERVEEKKPQAGVKELLRSALVWKLAFIQFGLGAFIWGMNAWLPSYWLEVKGLAMVEMGALSMLPWVVSFFCMNFSAYLLERYFAGKECLTLGVSLFLTCVCMYVMLGADSITAGFAWLTLGTVLASISSAIVYMIPMKYMERNRVGSATGIIIFGQQLAGVCVPIIMGYLISMFAGSYDAVFIFVIGIMLLGAVTSLSIRVR